VKPRTKRLIAILGGLAGLAGAVVLWLLPHGSDTNINTALVTEPHGASFHLGGAFQ